MQGYGDDQVRNLLNKRRQPTSEEAGKVPMASELQRVHSQPRQTIVLVERMDAVDWWR